MTMEKNCQQCLELLPWYVNGSLPAAQAQQVFQHLAQCSQCAEEQAFLSGLQQHVREQVVATPAPPWNKLQQRLDANTRNDNHWWKRGWIPAVAMAAAVAIFAVRLPLPSGPAPTYRLMTSSTPAVHAAHQAALLRVLLISGNDRQAAAQLFSSIDADVVAGPTPRGVFTVAMRKDIADRATFIESLRANGKIEFAEWVETP